MKEQPSKEETKTDNELIGEFMGYGSIAGEYDTSWDWLMPVCHKWDNLYKTDPLLSDRSTERYEEYLDLCYKLDDVVSVYEIAPTYNQIVNNIKWYNNETQHSTVEQGKV